MFHAGAGPGRGGIYRTGVSTPQIAQGGAVDISTAGQAGGNMEGKETRFGIATSGTWAAFTTAALQWLG